MIADEGLKIVIKEALDQVNRALSADWRKPNGESARANLEHLRSLLEEMLQRPQVGGEGADPRVRGLTKWVADWIPDVADPLLSAVDKVEIALE